MTTNEIITALANELAKYDPAFVVGVLLKADNEVAAETPVVSKPAAKKQTKQRKASEDNVWYDQFRSENTEVKVFASTVQVTVARGHASEWHDILRSNGFSWSRKNRNWWAYQDQQKRAKVAARNAANDAATAGMTAEQKRTYWRERRVNKVA